VVEAYNEDPAGAQKPARRLRGGQPVVSNDLAEI
jgi:hypothetical protein